MSVKTARSITRTFAVAVLAAAGVSGTAIASSPAQAATDVNMEKVVLAAQLDPAKEGTGTTEGAAESVKTVETALEKQGFLDSKYVDGHFGSSTVAAYSEFQKSTGASGEGANGLPGKGTLTQLGEKEGFTVSHVIDLGGRTTMDGQSFNQRTADMLAEAQKRSGQDFNITQGSYNAGVTASAGTHDGGGAVDIATGNLSKDERTAAVKALREVGFAAWDRTGVADFSPHIHAEAISDTDLDSSVWKSSGNHQIFDYYNGMDGLANHNPDNGPDVPKTTWEDYKRANGIN